MPPVVSSKMPITDSDLSYFIVPNYCDYPCANFFIFNERSQCFFQHHPELRPLKEIIQLAIPNPSWWNVAGQVYPIRPGLATPPSAPEGIFRNFHEAVQEAPQGVVVGDIVIRGIDQPD